MIQDDAWAKLQFLRLPYPGQPFRFHPSRCHWFGEEKRQALRFVLEHLPDDLGYLELGSFLGAGSTSVVLRACPYARLVCVDHWLIQGEYAAKHDLLDSNAPGTDKPCTFVLGRGEAWQHFLNNTFDDRHRILPIRRAYSSDLMYQLHGNGFLPDLILIDDDHRETPMIKRLQLLRNLWPQAHLLLDDFNTDEVRSGFYRAVEEYLCPLEDCELLANCLMWVKPFCTVY